MYDFDGNMKLGPLPATPAVNSTLRWDAENRLVEVLDAAGTTSLVKYAYDAFSRLVSAAPASGTATLRVYDGWNPIAEYAGQELGKTYLWGMDLSGTMQGAGGVGGLLAVRIHGTSTDAGLYHPTYDGNGNVSEYLTPGGSVAAHYEYDPFGNGITPSNRAGTAHNAFAHRFSTKPIDPATGLYYYGYRFYDPLTGRWPSRDPIGERGGMNLYGFVRNDTTNRFDIFGLKDRWYFPGSVTVDKCCKGMSVLSVDYDNKMYYHTKAGNSSGGYGDADIDFVLCDGTWYKIGWNNFKISPDSSGKCNCPSGFDKVDPAVAQELTEHSTGYSGDPWPHTGDM